SRNCSNEDREDIAAHGSCGERGGNQKSAGDCAKKKFVHRPPKRRCRAAKRSRASAKACSSKSGQSRSRKSNSAYAACHRRKLDSLTSREVRIKRSSSGRSCVCSSAAMLSSSIWPGCNSPAATFEASDLAAAAISEREP